MSLWQRHRRTLAVIMLVAFPLLMMSSRAGAGVGDSPSFPSRLGLSAMGWAQTGFAAPLLAVSGWFDSLFSDQDDVDLEQAKAEISRLREEKSRLIGVLQENERLRKLVGFKARRPELELVPGRVIARDTTPYFRVLTLKVSTTVALAPRMPVISADGVVGQVHRVFADFVEVILVSDPRHRVDAITQRTRAQAVVEGLGHERDYLAKLAYLSERDEVREGDLVVTSGMGGVFPPELVLGTVASVEKSERGLFQEATITPAVDASRLDEVFIVVGAK
ncbi:MAG: rod shape-determining protein MreC [bacterium]